MAGWGLAAETCCTAREHDEVREVDAPVVIEIALRERLARLVVVLGQRDQVLEVHLAVVVGVRSQHEEVERGSAGEQVAGEVGDARGGKGRGVVTVRQHAAGQTGERERRDAARRLVDEERGGRRHGRRQRVRGELPGPAAT